jgi:hypothetical protein
MHMSKMAALQHMWESGLQAALLVDPVNDLDNCRLIESVWAVKTFDKIPQPLKDELLSRFKPQPHNCIVPNHEACTMKTLLKMTLAITLIGALPVLPTGRGLG